MCKWLGSLTEYDEYSIKIQQNYGKVARKSINMLLYLRKSNYLCMRTKF